MTRAMYENTKDTIGASGMVNGQKTAGPLPQGKYYLQYTTSIKACLTPEIQHPNYSHYDGEYWWIAKENLRRLKPIGETQ